MADLTKLKAALRRTAADGIGVGLPLRFDTAEEGAALVLDLIDATLLGRRIKVELDNDAELQIEAAGRRLLRLSAPLKGGVTLEAEGELSPKDAKPLARTLLMAFTDASSMVVSINPNGESTSDPTEGGLSPDAMRDALGISPDNAAQDVAAHLNMEPFIAALEPTTLAALWLQDDDASLIAGDKDRVAELSAWAAPMLERLLSPEFPLAGGMETDGVAVFVLPDDAARHVFVAGRLGAYLVAEMEGADPSETLALWHKHRG